MKHNFQQKIQLLFLAIALLLTVGSFARAQETTGSMVGTVRDSSGAAVSGATVTISDPTKNNIAVRTLTTNDEGAFSVPNLPISIYTVTVEAPNFKKSVQTDVKVDVGQRRTVEVALEAGNISETVTVEADAVSVNLSTPTAATTINGDQVRELSVNNRNFVQLVTLAPGVTNDLADQVFVGTTNPDGQANTVNISVNGARSAQNTFTVDGADITDRGSNITIQAYPSIDSIGEFKVLRSLYPAESGNSGGGQVNVVTRSGTDKFHGSLFEFVRNEKLNANDFFTNQLSPTQAAAAGLKIENGKVSRRPLRYNNYGFTIGGPVFGPNFGEGTDGGFFKKYNRTFFFFSEEERKDIRYPVFAPTVPDANLRRGIFPVDVCLTLNAAGTACTETLTAGTQLPANRLNPTAAAYISQIYNNLPLPTNPTTYVLNTAARNVSEFNQQIIKIDHNFSDKLSAFYRYERDKIPTEDANSLFASGSQLPGVANTVTDSPGRAHTLQATYVLTPQTIIEGRYTYSYGAILSHTVGTLSNKVSNIPVTLPFVTTRDRVPNVIGNGFSNLQGFGPYDNFSNKKNIGGNITTIFGNHTMKYGANYSKYRKNENALVTDTAGPNQGSFLSFAAVLPANVGTGTGQTLPAGISLATAQNLQRFANFLAGNVLTFRQAKFDYTADLRQNNIEAYAQDEWRIRRNLTLYYGVRYSRFGQPVDKNGRLSNFIPELYNRSAAPQVTGAGNLVAGTGNFCNGLVVNSQNIQTASNCTPGTSPYGEKITTTSKKDFAPRVGLAFDPFGNGKTSIRTGYGIYHEQVLVGFAEQIIGANPPYQQNIDFTNVRLDNPAGATAVAPSVAAPTIRAIQNNWHTPYTQQWSLDVQRQLMKNTIVTVGYYGSKGTHLIGVTEINELPSGVALNSLCATGTSFFGQTPAPTLSACQVAGNAVLAGAPTNLLDQLRPYKGYRSITVLQPRYNSNYHSLQISGQHRFSGISQVNVAYTFSKNLTDNQTDRSTAPQNTYDIRAEYGRATLDRRHVFTTNYVYELPFFSKQEGFIGKTLGGWETQGIVTYQTGLPFTVTTSSYDPAGLGFISAAIAGGRPLILCNPNQGGAGTQQQFFNTACFATNQANPSGTNTTLVPTLVGTSGRGVVNGPKTFRVDFTLSKNIRFGESFRLQLRGEAFNVFNTTNFRAISTNVTAATFGQVTTVRDPRTLQLGIKLYF